ncbi:MAG: four helix bundle protein [Melioribacteraceae bacterium]|nr:MAG: four helix bundle protein [Melioribacteraceae bacterium]
MHNYKELLVWQKARVLVKDIYEITKQFPSSEKYGLISQIQRAAVSIPSNIAEGCGKNSEKELIRYLEIANSSTFELETQIILSNDLEFIKQKDFEVLQNKITEIQKMIFGLIKNIRSKS